MDFDFQRIRYLFFAVGNGVDGLKVSSVRSFLYSSGAITLITDRIRCDCRGCQQSSRFSRWLCFYFSPAPNRPTATIDIGTRPTIEADKNQ